MQSADTLSLCRTNVVIGDIDVKGAEQTVSEIKSLGGYVIIPTLKRS